MPPPQEAELLFKVLAMMVSAVLAPDWLLFMMPPPEEPAVLPLIVLATTAKAELLM